jgi:tetratricopeptide (TPR) repeat protein
MPGGQPSKLAQPILDYLNAGGTRQPLVQYLQLANINYNVLQQDLTNDGVPELLVEEGDLLIYTCRDRTYALAADLPTYGGSSPFVLATMDMNRDGMPEVVVSRGEDGVVDVAFDYQILEWDGQAFLNLVAPPDSENPYRESSRTTDGWIAIEGGWFTNDTPWKPQWTIHDTDNNGTLELVLQGGISANWEAEMHGPYRVLTTVYAWNGSHFVLRSANYTAPQYRIQAVQDADYDTLMGQYDQAQALYQQVISSHQLDWWSQAREDYELAKAEAGHTGGPPPTLPAPDPNEPDNLAAYAWYRLMLLQVLRGRLSDAQAAFDTLQARYPAGHQGEEYAALGATFWSEYQASRDVARACKAAVAYTDLHADSILYYIGGRHLPWQSHFYESKDVCPFQ